MINKIKIISIFVFFFFITSSLSTTNRRELLEFSNPIAGVRYVKLSHSQSKVISICQIECFDETNSNVTTGKTVESSNPDTGNSNSDNNRITDGNISNACSDSPNFYCSLSVPNFVKIDLNASKSIVKCKIYNRNSAISDPESDPLYNEQIVGSVLSLLDQNNVILASKQIKFSEPIIELYFANITNTATARYVKLLKDAVGYAICQVECYDKNDQNVTKLKSVTAGSINNTTGNPDVNRVTNGVLTTCVDYSDNFMPEFASGKYWLKINLGSDVQIIKCVITNINNGSENDYIKGSKLSLINSDNIEISYRVITESTNKINIYFTTIKAQLLYFKYFPSINSVTDYYSIQVNKSLSVNGLTALTPKISGPVSDTDFRFALEIRKDDNDNLIFKDLFLYNNTEYVAYRRYLPDYITYTIKDLSDNNLFYVIWILQNDTNHFISCLNSEYKSRFNIKLFSCLGDAYDFYNRISEFINAGDVILKKYVFDKLGNLKMSYSADSLCLNIIYSYLISSS